MTPLAANDPVSVGSFRLLGVLGSGGMGRVYLGESPTGRRVAIKVIRPDLAEDPAFRTRFQREVTAARTVSPLYTAAVVDADTATTSPWFATAYIDGPSLLSLVEANGPLAAGAVLTLAAGLAEALASIHGAGLVHRDLAPGNIILDDTGPHIIDFGIALAPQATKLTADQRLLGTPSYIAPEVIEGREADRPSDIFSLGAILAFAAAAKHLVNEGPLHAQILQITRGRFDLAAVPKEIRPLVVRCTAVNPIDRPTATELVRILVGAGVSRPTPGWFTSRAAAPSIKLPASPSRRVSRRRLLVTAGAAGVAAAAAGAAAWAGVFTRTPEPDAQPSLPGTGSPTSTAPRTPGPTRTGAGTIAWRARSGVMPLGLSSSGPPSPTRIIVDGGERLIGANASAVFAVGLDGRPVWTQTLPTGPVSLWGWGDGVLVADSRRLWLLDAASGEIRFDVKAVEDEMADSVGDNPDGVPIEITGVALSPDAAFVGLNTATVAFGPTGARLWRRPRPNARNGVRPPEGAPIATRDRWLVTHDASGPVVYLGLRDVADGTLQWLKQYDAAPDGPPRGGPDGHGGPEDASWSRSEGRITDSHIVTREVQELRVVALADGETVWSGASETPIACIELVGSTIFVAADRLRAYDVTTQAQLWEQDARGARVAVTESGSSAFVASDEGLSLVHVSGQQLWSEPYPSYLQGAAPEWAGVAGDLGYATFRPKADRRDPLDFDVIAVSLGTAP
jgi:serine/threonine protein kinase